MEVDKNWGEFFVRVYGSLFRFDVMGVVLVSKSYLGYWS